MKAMPKAIVSTNPLQYFAESPPVTKALAIRGTERALMASRGFSRSQARARVRDLMASASPNDSANSDFDPRDVAALIAALKG